MNAYVGMDVHRKRSQIAIMDAAGVQQRNRNLAYDPAKPVCRPRVRNQARTTTPVTGFCDAPPHGTPARLRPHLHHQTNNPSSRWTPLSAPTATGCSPLGSTR